MAALPAYVGRYKLCKEIGRGSHATVALAWDEELDSSVVLKILDTSDEAIEKRFLNEARLLRRVRAPNVVTVHDIGRLNDARPYFVLDYADRGTLADRLPHPAHLLSLTEEDTQVTESVAETAPAQLQALLVLVDALADGLSAIHSVGLVHRDVKPGNILFESVRRAPLLSGDQPEQDQSPIIRSDERALVGDLGIAKDLSCSTDQPTMMGGTPLFLAPEQLDPTASIASTADIYSATAVLWTLLTGSPPPLSGRLQTALADIPNSWQSILSVGMHADADKRFQSMDEWRWAIHDTVGNAGRTLVIEAATTDVTADQCPYMGLAAYQSGDADKFYGREAMIDELLHRLQLHDMLVVGGPSGSGKSSLVRAGLIPALAAGSLPGSEHWQVHLLTPGINPAEKLRLLLPIDKHALFVIDQFEEVFTLADTEQRTEFLDNLEALANQSTGNCKIVIVVRADFYAECARVAWLANRISNNQVLVVPMTSNELRRAISEPARRSGYFLERGLIEAILEQAGDEPGALPLIAHSLVETWVRRDGNTLTLAGFNEAGGVAGAISQTADAAFEHLLDDTGREQTRRLMLRLVIAGTGSTPDTRRVLSRAELDSDDSTLAIDHSVVRILTDARLLSIDDDTVQIAHEALLHRWPRLRHWIDDSRDDLRIRHKISYAANEWQTANHDADFLYRGTPLLAATDWLQKNPGLLSPQEQSFLDASLQHRDARETAERESLHRSRKLRRVVLVSLAALAIGASVSSLIAFRENRESRRNEALAAAATEAAEARFASALGAAAYGHVEEDPRLALVLAAESIAMSAPAAAPFDTRAAMVRARHTLQRGGPFLFGSPLVASSALSIALNPQGSILAIGSVNGSVEFIDTANRAVIQSAVKVHGGGIRDIAFSPDGRSIVTASTDGTLRFWQTDKSGQWTSELLARSTDVIVDVDFMPDGKSVISANDAGSVRRYFIDGREIQPPPITISDFGFNAVGISRDGKFVFTGNADKSINAFAIETGQLILGPIKIPSANHLVDFSISIDGKRFAVVDTDGEAFVFEFPSGELSDTGMDLSGKLGILFFHPDGQRLFGGDEAGRLKEWSAITGELLKHSAPGHSQIPVASSLSSDGGLLVTLGRDQIIRFWTLDEKFPMAREWRTADGAAKGVSFSPDGNYLASADRQGLVQIRRTGLVDQPLNLRGHLAGVWAVAYSTDGEKLASADRDGRVRVWNAMNGRLLQEVTIDGESVWSLAFTGNDENLLLGVDSGVLRYSISDEALSDRLLSTVGQLTRMHLSSDHRQLAISDSVGHVQLVDVDSGEQLIGFAADDDTIWSVAISPDSKTLAAASGSEIVSMYSTHDGKQTARLTGHAGGATNVAFLSDGATLVATDRDGRLHWWDIVSGRRLAPPMQAHRKSIWRMQVHPDGTRIVTAGDDGAIKMWNVLDVKRACDIGLPGFDALRREQYLGTDRTFSACSY